MLTCISRRACADRYDFRLTNEKGEVGKHIWTEYRCPNVVSVEDGMCSDCSVKEKKYKYQANQKCDHGVVGGPYTSDSKLYGSPYYLNELKNGWFPSEADENRAKAAVDKALSSMGRKKIQQTTEEMPAVVVEETPVAAEVPVERVKRKYVRKNKIPSTEQAVVNNEEPAVVPVVHVVPVVPAEKAKKTKLPKLKTPRSKKSVATELVLPQAPAVENQPTLSAKFIEVTKPPITITDFVVVKVKKLKCQGKDYYYDSSSGKVYGISVNGVGAYKGRYKEEDETLDTTFPDSDCE
jgi:hypothetical protein